MATMNKARATATRGQRNGRAPAGSSRSAGGCRQDATAGRIRRVACGGGERGDRPGRRVRSGSKKCTLAGAVRVGMHCENDVDVLNLGGWQAARRRTNPFGSRLENNAGAQARTRSQAVPAPPSPIIHDHVGQPSPTQQTWLQATRWGHIRRFTKRDRQDRRVHAAQFVNSNDKHRDNLPHIDPIRKKMQGEYLDTSSS